MNFEIWRFVLFLFKKNLYEKNLDKEAIWNTFWFKNVWNLMETFLNKKILGSKFVTGAAYLLTLVSVR